MRIAFYVPRASFLDLDSPGGDPILVHNLMAALQKRGHDVKVVSDVDVQEVWRGRIPARRLVTEAISIRKEMQRFSPDAWLVYTPSVAYPDLFGWWQRPKRYVLYGADTGKGERLPIHWRWLLGFAHRRSLARADGITVFRPKSAKHLCRAGVAPERIRILPPTSRSWGQLPSREEARRRLGFPQEAPVILSMCRFPRPKVPRRQGKTEMALDLLAALVQLPQDIILVIVGDEGAGRKMVEEEIVRLKLEKRVRLIRPEERVRLIGSTGNEDVKWFYAACDFYAYPHVLDRPWLSVMEAQTCGRPVVTMRTESSELIVDAGRTGLLANDLEEFRVHLTTLANDRAHCESMGQAAREYIAKYHSMENQVKQIEELLLGGD